MTEDEYQTELDRLAGRQDLVPMRTRPPLLEPDARFAVFGLGDKLVTAIVEGDDARGYSVRIDIGADGDLANDAIRAMEKVGERYRLDVETTAHAEWEGAAVEYPILCRLELERGTTPGADEARLLLFHADETIREGRLELGRRHAVLFGMAGRQGRYDHEMNEVFFDHDGDRQLATDDPRSRERYRVSERYVWFGHRAYAFEPDRFGRHMTLRLTRDAPAGRTVLEAGAPAPDFAFTDLDGQAGRLRDYRGRVVLVTFWGTWCAPCLWEVPELAELHARYHARGLAILGVHSGGTRDELRTFLTEKGISWRQILEAHDTGPIQKLYRVDRWPTALLIDRSGRIVGSPRGEPLKRALESLFSR